jgi:putative transposase
MGELTHICIRIPPKYTVSNVAGYFKGRSEIQIVPKLRASQKNFTGEDFSGRGYFVPSLRSEENVVRAYIRNQEEEGD